MALEVVVVASEARQMDVEDEVEQTAAEAVAVALRSKSTTSKLLLTNAHHDAQCILKRLASTEYIVMELNHAAHWVFGSCAVHR